jgi:hypothetical protein
MCALITVMRIWLMLRMCEVARGTVVHVHLCRAPTLALQLQHP